ncbi:hypothetical protein BQ8794_110275 [Mesorhizobium prunaredense]|uniref:Uncharacterized protein n=1 Tax=Mesorhizobium prunaredense TaxID=1631249 RepID=A0A1R3V0R2_9HYPH|nr:hypothetical protein BQ8794_110275 [Mesorhizobium prunaredense]
MRSWTLPGDSGLKLGPRGDKALYDPYAGIRMITLGGYKTFRRLKKYYPAADDLLKQGDFSRIRPTAADTASTCTDWERLGLPLPVRFDSLIR